MLAQLAAAKAPIGIITKTMRANLVSNFAIGVSLGPQAPKLLGGCSPGFDVGPPGTPMRTGFALCSVRQLGNNLGLPVGQERRGEGTSVVLSPMGERGWCCVPW